MNIRENILNCVQRLQRYLLENHSDDTESLDYIVSIYDTLIFDTTIAMNKRDHQKLKNKFKNKLVSNKKHFLQIHVERIRIQHKLQIMGKASMLNKKTPEEIIKNLYQLSVNQYSNVRSSAQSILCKIPPSTEIQEILLPLLEKSLKPDISQEFKGALYILVDLQNKTNLFECWKNASILYPALVKAQHSDKESIVDLLNLLSYKCNRSFYDFALWTYPIKSPTMSQNIVKMLDLQGKQWGKK
jgi:hypothetical protein